MYQHLRDDAPKQCPVDIGESMPLQRKGHRLIALAVGLEYGLPSQARSCSEAGLRSSANSPSGFIAPAVASHELTEQYQARGDALDFDDAVVAAATASR